MDRDTDALAGPPKDSMSDGFSKQNAAGKPSGPSLPSFTERFGFETELNKTSDLKDTKDVPESPSKDDSDIIVISDEVVILESAKPSQSEPVLDIIVPEASMIAESLPLFSSPPDSLSAYELESLKSDPAMDENSDIEVLKSDIKTNRENVEEKGDEKSVPEGLSSHIQSEGNESSLSEVIPEVNKLKDDSKTSGIAEEKAETRKDLNKSESEDGEQEVATAKDQKEKDEASGEGSGQCGDCECSMKQTDIEGLGTRLKEPAVEISLTVQAKINKDKSKGNKHQDKDESKVEAKYKSEVSMEGIGIHEGTKAKLKESNLDQNSEESISVKESKDPIDDKVNGNKEIEAMTENVDSSTIPDATGSKETDVAGHSIDPNEHVIAKLKPVADIHDKPMEKASGESDILGQEVKDMIDGMKSKAETAKDAAKEQGQFVLTSAKDSTEKGADAAKSKIGGLLEGAKTIASGNQKTGDDAAPTGRRRNRKRKGSRSKMQEKTTETDESSKPIKDQETSQPIRDQETSQKTRDQESFQPTRDQETSQPIRDQETSQSIRDQETSQPIRDQDTSQPIRDQETSQPIRDQEIHVKHPTNQNEFLSFGMKLKIEDAEKHIIIDVEEGGPASEIGLM